MSASRLSVLAVLLLSAAARADDADRVRALVRLPHWTHNFGVSWTDSGGVYITGDTPLARQSLVAARKAARKHSDSPTAQAELYKLLDQTGDRDGAAAALRKLIEIRRTEVAQASNDWKAYTALAWALQQRGDQAGAEAAARRAVELAPEESGAWRALALRLPAGRSAEAMRAMDKAAALATDDDLDTRLCQALMRVHARRRLLDRLPTVADPAAQGAVFAEVRQALLGIDKVLVKAAKRMKAADGTCGPDTRERCLLVMLLRDILRAKLRALAANGPGAKLDAVFVLDWTTDEQKLRLTADSARLLREIIPPTSDDLPRLIGAASFGCFAAAGDAAARAGAAPYLLRLDELSKGQPPARAATAIFLRGTVTLMLKDQNAAVSCFRRAVRLEPTFDLAWKALVKTESHADQSRATARGALLGTACQVERIHKLAIAREWVARSGSAPARYMLAVARSQVGDWPATERVIAGELAKHPDDPRLMLARAACWLRTTTTQGEFTVVCREMSAVRDRLQNPVVGTPELRKEGLRLAVLVHALAGDVANGRKLVTEYAEYAADKEDRADVLALRQLLDTITPRPPHGTKLADRR